MSLDLYIEIKGFGIVVVVQVQHHGTFRKNRPMARLITIQRATLHRARDLAGGVTFLARKLQIPTNEVDDMLHGRAPIPNWVFLRAVDYVNEHETNPAGPLGSPPGMQAPHHKPEGSRE
jgi:hypothetical protein